VIDLKNTLSLKKNYEINNVIKNGNFYSGKYLSIYILLNNENMNYICFAVSKKTGNSVQRNKIKRKLREEYHKVEENILLGYNIVVMWKKNIENEFATTENIKNDFDYIFRKANILN